MDKREFKNEHITISYHSGVSMYDSLFAVMLVQSQAIQIIHIKVHVVILARIICISREKEKRHADMMPTISTSFSFFFFYRIMANWWTCTG